MRFLSSADDVDAHGKQVEDTERLNLMQDVSNDKVASTIQSNSLTPDAPDSPDEVPVIYSRTSDSGESASKNAAPFRTEDAYTLDNDFVGGGQIISVHSPDTASAWLDVHFHDSLLESIRSGGIRGPIAVMLSPDEPALAIFGNLLDDSVATLAKLLSEASNFSVIVRPIMDDPIPKFIEAAAEQARLMSDPPRSKLPDDSGDPVVEHRDIVQGGNNTSTTSRRVVRIRGGAGSEEDLTEGKKRKGGRAQPMPEWEGDYHKAMVELALEMGQGVPYEVEICTSIQFKMQSEAPKDPNSWLPRPEVISTVLLDLKMRRSKTILDRSHSSIGFLVHRARSIFKCDFLDCGSGPPEVKLKHTKQKASQEMLGVTVGLDGGKPTMSANASFTRGASETLESADEKPMPRCDLRWDMGQSWRGPEKDYKCYDVSWWPASNRHGIANEMRVHFGLGMTILPNKRYAPGLPQISSILRNQIMVWVSDPTSPAKGRGILVLTSLYIANIQTNDTLTIYERISANLANHSNWVDDPPTAFENPTTHNAAMSVSVAALHRPDTRKTSGVLHKLRKLVKFPSSSGSKGNTVLQLPLYDAVSRGWDATNQRWIDVVWPSLNSKFQPPDGKDPAVWKLDWKTSIADREVEEVPVNITTPTVASGESMPAHIGRSKVVIDHPGAGSISGSSADGRTAAGDVLVPSGYETASTSATAFELSAHIPVVLITKPGLEDGET